MKKIENVTAIYFSATKTTEKITTRIAANLAALLDADYRICDISQPKDRKKPPVIPRNSLVVIGVPVYAGRVPYFLTEFLKKIKGNGSIGVAVCVYGNRHYDDALAELKSIMNACMIKVAGAGAFIGEHSFSDTLAAGRPDDADMEKAKDFYTALAEKLRDDEMTEAEVPGDPSPEGFYRAPTEDGSSSSLMGITPVTDMDLCVWCRECAKACPMDAISFMKPAEVSSSCIRCGACVKTCKKHAKSFTDPDYLYHKKMLEDTCAERKEPEFFI